MWLLVSKTACALCLLALVVGPVSAITQTELERAFPATDSILLEMTNYAPDPATDATYKSLTGLDVGKPISLGDEDVPAWEKKRKVELSPTVSAIRDEDIGIKHPHINKKSLQVADPSKIKRECPKQRCPANIKCFDPTYFCCKAGNYSKCCPPGTICLDTDPPTCLDEPKDDPAACTTEICRPDFHCPLSKVAVCCIGGDTCCPVTAKCVNTNPPTCKKLTTWRFLNQNLDGPQKVIKKYSQKGLSTKDAVPFARHPIPVIPSKLDAELPLRSKGKKAPSSPRPPSILPTKAKKDHRRTRHKIPIHHKNFECKECEQSLFHDTPTAPGTRTKQKSYFKDNKRITITETQHTIRLPDGRLKTKTKRHSVWSKVDPEHSALWPDDTTADLQRALSREHEANQLTVGSMQGKHYEHLQENRKARKVHNKHESHRRKTEKHVEQQARKKFNGFPPHLKKQWTRLQQWGDSIETRRKKQEEQLRAKKWAWVAKFFPKHVNMFPHAQAGQGKAAAPVIVPKAASDGNKRLKNMAKAVSKTKFDLNKKNAERAVKRNREIKRKKPSSALFL